MAVTAKWFTNAYAKAMNGEWNWANSTIKVALSVSSTPNQDTMDYFDDIVDVTGDGYTAGGATLGSKTITVDTTTNKTTLDAADVTWSSSTITASYAYIYADSGTASTSPLIAYVDFGESKVSSSGNFTITWDASGILTGTAA